MLRAGAQGLHLQAGVGGEPRGGHPAGVVRARFTSARKPAGGILGKLVRGDADGGGKNSVIELLSNRELEVFQFIGRGRGTRDIAAEMHVSVKTVETYRAHIKEKLKLRSAPELMRFAVDWVSQQGQN